MPRVNSNTAAAAAPPETDVTVSGATATPEETVAPAPDAFDRAAAFVLADRIEGGYVNDPRDPGGMTKFGISKRSYPKLDIANLTRDEATAIYRRDYWDAVDGSALPSKIAVAAFDAAVNQGVSAAVLLLQRAAGVDADGVIGPVTKAAIAAADEETLLTEFLSWRLKRYAHTANAATFMRGWANRVLALHAYLLTGELPQ